MGCNHQTCTWTVESSMLLAQMFLEIQWWCVENLYIKLRYEVRDEPIPPDGLQDHSLRSSSVGSNVAWEAKAPLSILASGTFLSEDLVMKIFLRPFVLFS